MAEFQMRHMKWWGWGDEEVTFSDTDKPKLWPYLKGELGMEDNFRTSPISFEDINLPLPRENAPFIGVLKSALEQDQISSSKKDRLIHAAGKSFRDLLRLRRGQVDYAPDLVVYPSSEDDVVAK